MKIELTQPLLSHYDSVHHVDEEHFDVSVISDFNAASFLLLPEL